MPQNRQKMAHCIYLQRGHFCLLGRFFPVLCKRQVNFSAQLQHSLLGDSPKYLMLIHFFAATLVGAAAKKTVFIDVSSDTSASGLPVGPASRGDPLGAASQGIPQQ
jgi:hypothetical protein